MMRLALLAALLLVLPAPAAAFWEKGHQTISAIAWIQLSGPARKEARALMRRSRELFTPKCPTKTIEQASLWADCVKEGERFSYAYSWHFQNVDICKPFDIKTPCPFGNCVSAQITRNARLLADRTVPQRERLQAFAFLVHFVGDLHQPLHAGDRGDLGGNRTAVSYAAVSGRNNLHAMWDGHLTDAVLDMSAKDEARRLLRAVPRAERSGLAAGSVEDWSRESWELARSAVYAPIGGGDPCAARAGPAVMTEADAAAAAPVIEQQLVRAGLRLARMLEEALAAPASRPKQLAPVTAPLP